MAVPPDPASLEHLAERQFSFYPPILNIEHNEWRYLKSTWSEVLVVNTGNQAEIWIPRRYVGEVSEVEEPVMIVGLNRELEFKGGALWPHQKRVLKMQSAGVTLDPAAAEAEPAAPKGFFGVRFDKSDKRIIELIGGVIVSMLVVYVLVVNWNRIGDPRQRNLVFTTKDQMFLELSSRDDYYGVTQKLGQPSTDRWRSDSGEIQYRALGYPDRHYTVILMGGERPTAHYIGALDERWTPIHSVELRTGGDTVSLLRSLKKF
jgi:hypothetical protein